MTMTYGFVKISAGSERPEIRRYEDADEGVNLNRIQEYWIGKVDQVTRQSRIGPRKGVGRKILTYFCG